MEKLPNTPQYFGTANKEAVNFRRKDVDPDYDSWDSMIFKYVHHHTGINPLDENPPARPGMYSHEVFERNRRICKAQIINYIQNN